MKCVDQEGCWSLTLPPSPNSSSSARRFLRDALEGKCSDDQLHNAQLCLSELVTNAVLHANSTMEITISLSTDTVRLTVSDASAALPLRAVRTESAATGRGLGLVSALSRDWGIDAIAGSGKAVWCLVPTRSDGEDALASSFGAWSDELVDSLEREFSWPEMSVTEVHLVGYPVRLGMRSQEHFEALRRECHLLQFADSEGHAQLPKRLLEMSDTLAKNYSSELSGPEKRKFQAYIEGSKTVDLTYFAPVETSAVISTWQEVMQAMDRFCEEQDLLTLATPPDFRALRQWTFDEFNRQLAGESPKRWTGTLE